MNDCHFVCYFGIHDDVHADDDGFVIGHCGCSSLWMLWIQTNVQQRNDNSYYDDHYKVDISTMISEQRQISCTAKHFD
jgi:hypothetical protein